MVENMTHYKRDLKLNGNYINLPIKHGIEWQDATLKIGDREVISIKIELADGDPDYWTHIEVSQWRGASGLFSVDGPSGISEGLEAMTVTELPEGNSPYYGEQNRLQFHYSPKVGWTNDPNGLLYYEGEWHLFYQYNPYSARWQNMCWGHAVSTDLAHWEELPIALHYNQGGDLGIYSGSGIIDQDNASGLGLGGEPPLLLYYTDNGRSVQCLAFSNDKGRSWERYSGNPVVPTIRDRNRDPKVFRYEPGDMWVMILYIEENEFALLNSKDLVSWSEVSRFKQPQMCECPDLFELPLEDGGSRWIFISGWGKHADGDCARYVVGSFDGETFTPESDQIPVDLGIGNYSTQTFSNAPDGRRIFTGWFTRRFTSRGYPGMPSNGQFRVPWDFTMKTLPEGVRLCGNPIPEIKSLRGKKIELNDHNLQPGETLKPDTVHDLLDLELHLRPEAAKEIRFEISGEVFAYNVSDNQFSGFGKSAPLPADNGKISFRILVDRHAVEIFAREGGFRMSGLLETTESPGNFGVSAVGGTARIESMVVYEMRSIWD